MQGKCIELQGSLTDAHAVNRSNAWNEVDAQSDAYETVVQVPTEWDATLFLSGTANALQANPDANCMFLAVATLRSTRCSRRWRVPGVGRPPGDPNQHVALATQDLFPEALVLMEQGYIDVTTTQRHLPSNTPRKLCVWRSLLPTVKTRLAARTGVGGGSSCDARERGHAREFVVARLRRLVNS